MRLSTSDIEISKDSPFANDLLDRKDVVIRLCTLLQNVEPPFVVCIDAPWGLGKTTFIRLCAAYLESIGMSSVSLNAWKSDFAADPLVAFVGELAEYVASTEPDAATTIKLETFKKVSTHILKRAIPAAIKVATAGAVDLDSSIEDAISDATEQLAKDAIDEYSGEKALVSRFREHLSELVAAIAKADTKPRLIVFVDELDRCRPTYAIECLERIKHFFDVPNIVFVLAIDKVQLAESISAIYGSGMDSAGYLARFIDLDHRLPDPPREKFAGYLTERFGIDQLFAERREHDSRFEPKNISNTLLPLIKIFRLSLRDQARCFARLKLALLSTQSTEPLYPHLTAALIILQSVKPQLYTQYVQGDARAYEVLKLIETQAGGAAFIEDHHGTVLETFLRLARPTREQEDLEFESFHKQTGEYTARMKKMFDIHGSVEHAGSHVLRSVVSRVELGLGAKIE